MYASTNECITLPMCAGESVKRIGRALAAMVYGTKNAVRGNFVAMLVGRNTIAPKRPNAVKANP